ncbi:MAG: hypothetical protein ACTSUE_21645 [Promethearchaeota archaeon]
MGQKKVIEKNVPKKKIGVIAKINGNFRTVWEVIIRYLKNDIKYKFKLLFNSIYTTINLALFTIIADVVQPKPGALPPEYGEDGFLKFLFLGTYLWALFSRPFEETVNCLPEETQKGTLGLLITNNVSVSKILIGRFFASFIISSVLATAVCMPFIAGLGMLTFQATSVGNYLLNLGIVLAIFTAMVIFMLCISLWVASFSLLFKKTGVLANVFIYGLKVATGMYFPVFGMGNSALLLGSIPVSSGIDMLRDIFIAGGPMAHGENITIMGWQFTSVHFVSFFLLSQLLGVIGIMFVAAFALKSYTKKAKLMGTIESY